MVQLKFWALDDSHAGVNAGTASVYTAADGTPSSVETSAASNADGMVTFTGLAASTGLRDVLFDKGGKGFFLKGNAEWMLSRLYTKFKVWLDQSGDPSAPGAGETLVYAKAGALYSRAGAAGAVKGLDIGGNSTIAGTLTGLTGVTTSGTVTANGSVALSGTFVPPATDPPAAGALTRGSLLKASAKVTYSGGTPSLAEGYNIASITDDGVGVCTVAWNRAFANTNYTAVATVRGSTAKIVTVDGYATDRITIHTYSLAGAAEDDDFSIAVFGTQ